MPLDQDSGEVPELVVEAVKFLEGRKNKQINKYKLFKH